MVILDFETVAVTGEAAAFRDVASEFANCVAPLGRHAASHQRLQDVCPGATVVPGGARFEQVEENVLQRLSCTRLSEK